MAAENILINRVNIESPRGDKAFLIFEGDIFKEQADVYIFNSYKGKSGTLVDQLKEKYELEETPFYFGNDGTEVSKIKWDGKWILLLHSDLIEFEPITVGQYESLLQLVFASLTALESYGERIETVAFPVLFRNGLSNIYLDAVKVLIEKSTLWLKQADGTMTIKYMLYEKGDKEIWSDHLNEVLGRRMIDPKKSLELLHFKNRALALIEKFDSRLTFWDDTILPIKNSLLNEDFSPEVVAAFARKLLEVYCHERSKAEQGKPENLDAYLAYLRQNKILNRWDMQTLYQIRSFGNPSVHRPDPLFGQLTMDEKDVTILLICLCKLLEMLHEFMYINSPHINA